LNAALAVGLALANVGLAMFAFVVLARPERALTHAAWLAGLSQELLDGELTAEEEMRLEGMARRIGPVLVVVLVAFSFVTGALMTRLRLGF
jgi:hypothetical protein